MAFQFARMTPISCIALVIISSAVCAEARGQSTTPGPLRHTSTPTSAGTGNTTRTPEQETSATGAGDTSPKTTCLGDWLRLSGATDRQVQHIPSSGQAVLGALDETRIRSSDTFFLSLLLGFDTTLADDLKKCVERKSTCPTIDVRLPCGNTGRCVFDPDTRSTVCNCSRGLVGSRCEHDVDECLQDGLNDCDTSAAAICANTHGSYACECRQGFDGNGRDCQDINECESNAHDCHRHAHCNNTVGSYSCACKTGYLDTPDGQCEVDLCTTSENAALCRKIQQVTRYNKALEGKLAKRDKQISSILFDVKVMSTIFAQYHREFGDMRAGLETTRAELAAAKRELHSTKSDIAKQLDEHKSMEAGLVSWKSFTKTTHGSGGYTFDVRFNKTRTDTVLRVVYTSVFGVQYSSSGPWYCFTISVRINGNDCSDPGPIRSGASLRTYSGSFVYTALPGSVSGTCANQASGILRITTHLERHCHSYSATFHNVGYYAGGATHALTASLYIEELASGSKNRH
ncbi:adhesion G protein-coupled receptor E2-like [Sycon ciliatum]|uniref:adhesion G protein-coupled receptor E2-like n=1 Tax=Sycon ciliatum TaxID=27933 RepID=UPI0031F6CC94